MKIITIMTGLILMTALIMGCNGGNDLTEREELEQRTREAVEAAGEYADATREEAVEDLQGLSDRLKTRLEKLAEDTEEGAEELRAQLSERAERVNQALSDAREASEERWSEIRQNTANLVKDIGEWLSDGD